MVKNNQIKPFTIYFEKELRYFLIALSLFGILGNLIDIFTLYGNDSSVLIFNISTISAISCVIFFYFIKIQNIQISFAFIVYILLSNIILSFLYSKPVDEVIFFFFRESLFIILLISTSLLVVNILNGIIILIIYILFYIAVMNHYQNDFMMSNIYIVLLMVISYTILLSFFAKKLNHSIIEIQKDTLIITEKNEELLTINNELLETQKIINVQHGELLNLSKDLKEKNDEIAEKNNELTEAIKTKNLFFSIIAHDLKSPIGSMTELTSLMLERYDNFNDEKKQYWIKNIYKSSKSLFELLENLLLWSRTNLGIINPKYEEIVILDCIDKLHKIFNQNLLNKKINFFSRIEKDLVIVSDKMMIETILRNLISNAIKFTNENGEVEVIVNKTSNQSVSFCISDRGVGMSPEIISKLDNIGNKYSTIGTSGEKGSGLGLHLCKLFISKLNGEMKIESQPKKGTSIIFTIPVC